MTTHKLAEKITCSSTHFSWIEPRIDNCFEEKTLLEIGNYQKYGEYLSQRLGGSVGIGVEPRIIEVYRLCHQQAPTDKERDAVLTDFVSYFPILIFEAEWLIKLVKKYGRIHDFVDGGPESRTFSALAKGFQRAAKPRRFQRHLRTVNLFSASIFRTVIYSGLKQWGESLERDTDPGPEWLGQQADQKAEELCGKYAVLERYRIRLRDWLRLGQYYKAAVHIAATVHGVRVRDLQGSDAPVNS
jgi:hypothetical protein